MKTGMKTIIKAAIVAVGMGGFISVTAQAAYFDTAPAPRCAIQLNRQLRTGSEGVDVSVLQDFLNRAGYLRVVPNGHYGPATTAAVRAFQSGNFISVTGQVGPLTLNAINERMCDTDLHANSLADTYSAGYAGIQTGVTYVDPFDPFVRVITPQNTVPTVYTNPQNTITTTAYSTTAGTSIIPTPSTVITPATTGGILSTNIIYSPAVGYTYGITPASGVLTIITPQSNATYREGDTVQLSWTTNNLNANGFNILLENASTNQSRIVTSTTGNGASFALTRELLDAVCAGACSAANQDNYRIVISTPVRDIAGNVTTLRAAVQPVIILRPFTIVGPVTLSVSKSPVSSGEVFRLYATIPFLTGTVVSDGQYSFRIRATCPSGVTVSVAGAPCGQDFTLPYNSSRFQSEIPVMIGNSTYFRQDVTFTLTALNAQGQVIGSATTTAQVSATPFSF